MEIEPQVTLPIVYQTTDPFDSTVYFIRAVVRDSTTGAILKTLNLVSRGSGRYTSSYQTPADGIGTGRHIDITKTVYTDSGHTIISENYRQEIDKYLIRTRSQALGAGFGSGTSGVDYTQIAHVVRQIVAEALAKLEIKPVVAVDLTPLETALAGLERGLLELRPEPVSPPNLDPVLLELRALHEVVSKLPTTQLTEADLDPMVNGLGDLYTVINQLSTGLDKHFAGLEESNREHFSLIIKNFRVLAKQIDGLETEPEAENSVPQTPSNQLKVTSSQPKVTSKKKISSPFFPQGKINSDYFFPKKP